jgi:hypothetical protein
MGARIDLTLDCADATVVAPFWKLALGYEDEPPPEPYATREDWLEALGEPPGEPRDGAWLRDPAGVGPRLSVLRVPEGKVAKNRLHIDIRVEPRSTPAERASSIRATAERLVAAGGTVLVDDGHHVTMADPEGNEFCVA